MTLKKLITSAAVSAIAAGSLVPLSSAANAAEWNHRGHGPRVERHVERGYHGGGHSNRWGEQRQHNAWRGGDHDEGGYRRHRDRTGRYLAIGAFATILGLALASQQNHVQHQYYDDNND
jgi:hypothetical protein